MDDTVYLAFAQVGATGSGSQSLLIGRINAPDSEKALARLGELLLASPWEIRTRNHSGGLKSESGLTLYTVHEATGEEDMDRRIGIIRDLEAQKLACSVMEFRPFIGLC